MSVESQTASDKDTDGATLTAQVTATRGSQIVNPTSVGFRFGTISNALDSTQTATPDANGNFTATLSGLEHSTTYYWVAYATVEGTEYTSQQRQFTTTTPTPEVTVTSISYTELSAGYAPTADRAYLYATYTATLAGEGITPTAVGFLYGTSTRRAEATKEVTVTEAKLESGKGSYFHWQYDLQPETTYYWWAWVEVDGKKYYSDSKQFTTEAAANTTPAVDATWLELPAEMTGSEAVAKGHITSDLFTHTYYYSSTSDANRNYTICYNPDELTTYWVAYNLKSSHMGTGRSDEWAYVSEIDQEKQANIVSASYKNKASNGTNNYDRGHLLPSSSRNYNTNTMNKQTFYVINIAPQNADFNQKTWNKLEQAVQSVAENEEVFVVTGTMCAQVSDGNGSFTPERTYDNSGKEIPVPRYFYKVVLKVNKSGSTVTDAKAIGFWFTNISHTDDYTDYAVSVNQIEEWTGLNFFVNLSDTIEESAESNSSWSSFQSF